MYVLTASAPQLSVKMECDDMTEDDYYTSTMDASDVTSDSDATKGDSTANIKMAPPEESMTLEDFVNQETARNEPPQLVGQPMLMMPPEGWCLIINVF